MRARNAAKRARGGELRLRRRYARDIVVSPMLQYTTDNYPRADLIPEPSYGQLFAGAAFNPSPAASFFAASFQASGVAAAQRVVPHFALSQLPPRVWYSPSVRTGQVHCALVESLGSTTQGWSSQDAQAPPVGQLIAPWIAVSP